MYYDLNFMSLFNLGIKTLKVTEIKKKNKIV